jgi:hypothetical protein
MEEINPGSKVHYPVCMTKSGYGNIGQMNSEWIFILLSCAQKKIKELAGI